MNLNYNTDIPLATNNPSVDQPNMQVNTNSINSWVAIDHHGFEDNLGGYHTIIHQDSDGATRTQVTNPGGGFTRVGFPAAIPGVNQLFSVDVTPLTLTPTSGPDTQLFSMTGGGGISQVTGGAASQRGYEWIGNNIVQWGKVTQVLQNGNTGTVTFLEAGGVAISFPNNIWNIQLSLFVDSGGTIPNFPATIAVDNANTDRLGFKWYFIGPPVNSGRYQGFYWYAVGN